MGGLNAYRSPEALYQVSIEEAAQSAAGVWGVSGGGLACEFAVAGPPVSIQEVFHTPERNETGRRTFVPSSSGECPRRVPIRHKDYCGVSRINIAA